MLPNRFIASIIATYLISILFRANGYLTAVPSLAIALFATFVMLGFYVRQGMAAGDVKMTFVTFLWVTPTNFVISALVFSACIFITLYLTVFFTKTPIRRAQIPFGVPLALTGITAVALQ